MDKPTKLVVTPVVSALRATPPAASDDAVKCERCGAEDVPHARGLALPCLPFQNGLLRMVTTRT